MQALSGFAKNAALRLTATAIPRFNVRQLLFGRVNYEKTNTIIIAAAFLLVGCMFAHVGCIPYDPSMMESYWGAQSGGNSIFDNDANNWNGSAGESLFQTPNTYDGQDQQYQQPDSQQNQPAITEEPTEDPNIPMTTKEPDSLEIYELKVVDSNVCYWKVPSLSTDTYGNTYVDAINWGDSGGFVTYYIAGKYARLEGVIAASDSMESDRKTVLTIYTDDVLIYTSPTYSRTVKASTISLDISGADTVTIKLSCDDSLWWGSSIIFKLTAYKN